VWRYTGNKSAKFHRNILSLSENIAKSFRGATFLTHTVYNSLRTLEINEQEIRKRKKTDDSA